jgi:MYND finger
MFPSSTPVTTCIGVGKSVHDAGTLLWTMLKKELQQDENGFKHRVYVLDSTIKGFVQVQRSGVEGLRDKKAGDFIPFFAVDDNCPWNGCKFAAMSVLHFVSKPDAGSKRDAVRPVCRSLGGCTIPSPTELCNIRWPYALSTCYATAVEDAQSAHGICTAILVSITDVELMRNPGKNGGRTSRPGTFAHCFVMSISPAGLYVFQAYGPRGYTLLQNMESHSEFPLSLAEGKGWVTRFEEFSGELSGVWTQEVNDAYAHCFEVDLVKLGGMRLGSQLDAYFTTVAVKFDANRVRENFALLPMPDTARYPKCRDGVTAKARMPPADYTPDGGKLHYYVPVIVRCARCGKNESGRNQRCSRCLKVRYCSKDCQVADWQARHHRVCKSLAAK